MQYSQENSLLGSLLRKVDGLRVCNFFKNKLQHRCFLWTLQNFYKYLSDTTPLVAASDSPTMVATAKSARVPVLWFRVSTCFRFWSKSFTKCCANNFLLSRDKTISSLLELIGHVLSISEYVLEKRELLSILMKNTKRCTSNCVISRVKRLSSAALCGWSGAFNFRVWFGKRNMAVKIPILILFRFCLIFWHKDIINPYNYLLKNDNFSIKTAND